MVQVVNPSQNDKNTQTTSGQAPQQPTKPNTVFPGLSAAGGLDLAFGVVSTASNAAAYVEELRKMKEANGYLKDFKFGTVNISASFGSAAWVSFPYNQYAIFGVMLFQNGDSFRLRTTENGAESYYTTISLCREEFVKVVEDVVRAETGLEPFFITFNDIPATPKQMDEKWAKSLTAEFMQNLFSTIPGFLGEMKLNKDKDRVLLQVGAVDASRNFLDSNGLPHRADFSLTVSHQNMQQQSVEPTILTTEESQQFPRVHAAGYVNLRVTGRNPDAKGDEALHQAVGEVVCSLMSSQLEGFATPIERQNIALAGFAEVAQRGGWKDSYIRSLHPVERRISTLLQWLTWEGGVQPDVKTIKEIDKSPDAIRKALDTFTPDAATVAVNYRVGDGVCGLARILYEIAQGDLSYLRLYTEVLDRQFPGNPATGEKSFTQAMGEAFKTKQILPEHIIGTVVPTVAGYFTRDGDLHSFEECDVVSALTAMGDRIEDAYEYLRVQSYFNRDMTNTQIRNYLLKLTSKMYGGFGQIPTGESVTMTLNPIFAQLLIRFVHRSATVTVQGVTTYDKQANSLFINDRGIDFTVGSVDTTNRFSDFGGTLRSGDISSLLK